MLSLVFHDARTRTRHSRAVPDGEAHIGRAEDNEIPLPFDENLSRRHARVTRIGRAVRIEDLQSTNGILVGSARVPSVVLHPGDAPVQIGSTFVTIEEADTGDLLPAFPVERAGNPERAKATLPVDDDRCTLAGRGLQRVVRKSVQMQRVVMQALAFARLARPVLLLGETGTGKEVIARLIHDNGPNPGGPFVAVNCATMTRELIHSELFGIEDGVATGVRARRGFFAEAEGGTLFLDEIGDIDIEMQATLLRALEEHAIRAAGMRRSRTVRLRVILATNRRDRIRADLYFRCKRIDIPPLRERPEDIANLARHFLDAICREQKVLPVVISQSAVALLAAHPWPGNARELNGVLEDAVVLFGHGGMLHAEHIANVLGDAALLSPSSLVDRHAALTRAAVAGALREHDGNQSAAARALGMSRSGIRKAMRRFQL
ncbi:MAG TPA: sigma 54-interacting transcriptional regulator [Thermoanaerobaculia bacterium]|nr:sigma 54-interacting transcriptional regulator [Thermoanaerobaculia bacterium]